jgi:hypothetical protein
MDGFQDGNSPYGFLGRIKHQWPYLSWDDIAALSSPLFWTFIVLLFGGLFFAGRKTMLIVIPLVVIFGLLGLFGDGIIAAYTVLIIPLVVIALFRRNRFLGWSVLSMILIGDINLTLDYAFCLSDYNRMTSGPGIHKIPGELWEGMQESFSVLDRLFYFHRRLGNLPLPRKAR